MPGVANYPGGFANGITIRGVPLVQTHPGKVFWVSNATTLSDRQIGGSDGNQGTFDRPFSTIAGALLQTIADRGDIVFVKPGHIEAVTAAAGIILSKAGVAIVGLGSGSNRPTINFTTANTATITVTASNVSVQNILFVGGFLNVATCFSIANAQVAKDFTVDSCEFRDSGAALNFVACVKIGTTSNIADGFQFTNNKVIGLASAPAAGTTAVVTASTNSRWNISNNWVTHQILLAATAPLLDTGALNLTNSIIRGNVTNRPNTDASYPSIFTSTGTAWLGTMVADNYGGHLSGATGLIGSTGTTAAFIQNFSMITGAQDKSALINPAAV